MPISLGLGLGITHGGAGGGASPAVYRRDFTQSDYRLQIDSDYLSSFLNTWDDGFCFYIKVVWPSDVTGNPRFFGGRYNGGLQIFPTSTNEIAVTNWASLQTGTTQFSGGDIVSILVRHNAAGTTTIHSFVEGGVSTTLESSEARSYTATQSSLTRPTWGGAGSLSAKTFMYDSAFWIGDVVSEADGLDLLTSGKGIADIATAPDSWIDARRGFDKAGNYSWLKNNGLFPASPFYDATDVPGSTLPTNFCVLKDPETGIPIQYDAGSGALYWAAYSTSNAIRLATSTNLSAWNDSAEIVSSVTGQAMSDFLYMGNVSGAHDPFFLFYSIEDSGTNEAKIYLRTSSDMATFSEDAANPIFVNSAGPGNGIEDFRVAKIADSYWMAVYEQDNYQTSGVRAVGAALNTNAVPTGSWTNQTDDFLGDADVGFTGAGEFVANPSIVRKGSDLWVFYEGISGSGDWTLARKKTLSGTSGVFDGTTYEKWGVVAYSSSVEFHFPNCATVESGKIYLYIQSGGSTTGGIKKQLFDDELYQIE